MRIEIFLAAALLASAHAGAQETAAPAASGSTAPGAGGLACFENLSAPEYPKTALQAHVDGSVWTWTQVNSQGTIDKIDTQVVSAWGDGPKLLTPAVEKAIRAAKIKPACAGSTVPVVFRYELRGEAVAQPKVVSRTEAPNILYIESQPATTASAAAKASTKQ